MDTIIPEAKWPVEPPVGTDRPVESGTWPSAFEDGPAEPWRSEFPHDAWWQQ